MELRKRLPRERSYIHEKQDVAASLQPPTSHTGHGVFNGLLALIGYLVQLLNSVVYGSTKKDLRQEEDADEDKSDEEAVLLGHTCRGLIAVRERRRKRSTAIILSSNRDGEAPSALKHAAAAYHFLRAETHPRLLGCLSSGPPIILEHAPLGNVHALVSSKIAYPSLAHPSIPSRHAALALPLSWLLQTSSALRFLHDQKVTHGAISPSSLFLRSDMSIAITDFTKSTINGHNNGVPTRAPKDFAFPVDALRYDYFDGELSANSQSKVTISSVSRSLSKTLRKHTTHHGGLRAEDIETVYEHKAYVLLNPAKERSYHLRDDIATKEIKSVCLSSYFHPSTCNQRAPEWFEHTVPGSASR
ncbi:hypothetical protein AUEXF2481DRAFT_328418 [Aureobasidium subglaciale EXF-2481]|uniref:Serine-threonine/tyrosine-protein kinase catalytic domain-containing protein n=1 Tax=Aureobasidium subglaciale (strain EXF-2481) TaxID=1043005 RepID=A0A074YHS7_AURSE|nr:uncharacterized protein AUEXF2481DRAFT_328418 [Aureobasidium subglaciale EXF-2481]KEQ93617.1 hypothetical protein AUEXF2481DRAFT_328418 [Aureobasidium subglaciale EXF-2481]